MRIRGTGHSCLVRLLARHRPLARLWRAYQQAATGTAFPWQMVGLLTSEQDRLLTSEQDRLLTSEQDRLRASSSAAGSIG